MNAAGLTVVLTEVSTVLGMPFYQSLVTNGSIRQDEFDGTRGGLAAILATLKNTPQNKIEAMVDYYNDDLTEYLNKFNSGWTEDVLGSFRNAQVMVGYVTTIMAKSGISG
jgi:hypothetical protein